MGALANRVGNEVPLASGMALQCDIIPTPIPAGTALNCRRLRRPRRSSAAGEIASRHPELWARINRNRELMQSQLGLTLRPETLPLSLANAYLPTGLALTEMVCALA